MSFRVVVLALILTVAALVGCQIPRRSVPAILEMADIPGGTFLMGAPRHEKYPESQEQPRHEVMVKPFLLARSEVTREQWRALGLPEPEEWRAEREWDCDLPANYVSWDDAARFCNELSRRERLPLYYLNRGDGGFDPKAQLDSGGYRLPSESEWEWACRANQPDSPKEFYGNEPDLQHLRIEEFEWDSKHAAESARGRRTLSWPFIGLRRQLPIPVARKSPNAFGLFDMLGNLWEWCDDLWHDTYEGAPAHSAAWLEGSSLRRVLRGGSFRASEDIRISARGAADPLDRFDSVGFRPARSGSK